MNDIREQDLQIPVGELVRILLVEDEPGNSQSLREVLEYQGYSVQVASNPTEGKLHLDAMNFGMVISDQVFDGYSTEGDSFLLENSTGEIPKVLVTGKGVEGIRRKAELEERGIPILEKGQDDFHPRLQEIAHAALETTKRRVVESVNSILPPADSSSDRIVQETRSLLLGWLRTRQDGDSKAIFYGGRVYSASDLIREIETSSEVGEAHFAMFLRVVRKVLGL